MLARVSCMAPRALAKLAPERLLLNRPRSPIEAVMLDTLKSSGWYDMSADAPIRVGVSMR